LENLLAGGKRPERAPWVLFTSAREEPLAVRTPGKRVSCAIMARQGQNFCSRPGVPDPDHTGASRTSEPLSVRAPGHAHPKSILGSGGQVEMGNLLASRQVPDQDAPACRGELTPVRAPREWLRAGRQLKNRLPCADIPDRDLLPVCASQPCAVRTPG